MRPWQRLLIHTYFEGSMSAIYQRLTVQPTTVHRRIKRRLGGSETERAAVIWQMPWHLEASQQPAALKLDLSKLTYSFFDGCLLLQLPVFTDMTQRQGLQAAFHLGTAPLGANLEAAARIEPMNRSDAKAAQAQALVDRWGTELLRVMWDGVLDCIEGSMQIAAAGAANQPLTLLGYSCSAQGLVIDIQLGN